MLDTFTPHRAAFLLLLARRRIAFRAEAARDNTPLHAAADKHLKTMTLAVLAALRLGQKALGDPPDASRAAAAVNRALLKVLPTVLLATMKSGGETSIVGLRKLKLAEAFRAAKGSIPSPLKIRFDETNPRAAKWARAHAAESAKSISETTEQRIKDAIASVHEGKGLREGYHIVLDAIGGEVRASMIARTETMAAANEGNREGWRQATEVGLLTGDERKTWIATSDACPECQDLDEQETDLEGSYPGDGEDGPPLHPNCRCTEGIVG